MAKKDKSINLDLSSVNETPPIKKEKKPKDRSKKTRINFMNYKSTNGATITMIYTLRIICILFLALFPIVIALTITYDPGIKAFAMYTFLSMPTPVQFIAGVGSIGTENAARIIPLSAWFLLGILTLLLFAIPFLVSTTSGAKAFLGFYYMFLSILGFFLIYGMQYLLIDIFPETYNKDNPFASNSLSLYWNDLKTFFKWSSPWLITIQVFHLISFLFGIWCAIEASLIKKGKLQYDDLIIHVDKTNSLVNNVLNGALEFGTTSDEDLKLSINKLKTKLKNSKTSRVVYADDSENIGEPNNTDNPET